MASSAIRAFISALKLRRCLDFIFTRFPRQRFYTLMSGPNFGEHFIGLLLRHHFRGQPFTYWHVALGALRLQIVIFLAYLPYRVLHVASNRQFAIAQPGVKAHSSNRSCFFLSSMRCNRRNGPAAVSNSFSISSSVYASGSRSGLSGQSLSLRPNDPLHP